MAAEVAGDVDMVFVSSRHRLVSSHPMPLSLNTIQFYTKTCTERYTRRWAQDANGLGGGRRGRETWTLCAH